MAEFKITTEKYTFLKLEEKYRSYLTPAFKISVEGQDLVQSQYMAISDISAESSVAAADCCSFNVNNAYNYDEECFKWTDQFLTVGKKLTIEMGYVDKLSPVFEGYITQVTYEFAEDEPPHVRVEGMDTSFLMMKGKKTKLWAKKKHSDIVTEIAGKYSLKAVVTDTTKIYESFVQNNASDYEFINLLADMNDHEFFVTGSSLYFRKRNDAITEVLELKIGESLMGFKYSVDLASQIAGTVTKGYNIKEESLEGKGESITKLGSGKSDGVSEIKKLNSKETLVELYEPILTKEEATLRAKSYLNKMAMNYVTGSGTACGIPEIRGGRCIQIAGMWKNDSRLFYISSAQHSINEQGYKTVFMVEGNAI